MTTIPNKRPITVEEFEDIFDRVIENRRCTRSYRNFYYSWIDSINDNSFIERMHEKRKLDSDNDELSNSIFGAMLHHERYQWGLEKRWNPTAVETNSSTPFENVEIPDSTLPFPFNVIVAVRAPDYSKLC